MSLAPAHPALAPYAARFGELIALDYSARLRRLNEAAEAIALKNAFQRPIRFGAAQPSTKAIHYEWAIGGQLGEKEGLIATRSEGEDAVHDLLNALIWLDFPKFKAHLNFRQVSEIDQERSRPEIRNSQSRSPRRDQITLFDENGAVFLSQDLNLTRLLESKDWAGLFILNRTELLLKARLQIVGHGLLQKCLHPFKSMTARVAILPLPADASLAEIDQGLATHLEGWWPDWPKVPLPIAGWPTWSENQDDAFYADKAVFR